MAFGGLTLLIAGGVGTILYILHLEQRHEFRVVQESRPFIDAIREMDSALAGMISAARGYDLTSQTSFVQQYDDAERAFETNLDIVRDRGRDSRDLGDVNRFVAHYKTIKALTDEEIEKTRLGESRAGLSAEIARQRSNAPDFDNLIVTRIRAEQSDTFDEINAMRQWVTLALVLVAVAVLIIAATSVVHIEQRLRESIGRQVRRTEAMIAGMADGVQLVDGEGRVVFINPAGQRLLGRSDVGIPIFKQAEVYRLRDEHNRLLDPQELPAAQALSTGRAVHDVTIIIARENSERVAVSMSATPLHEDGQISGVVVTFRDITERRAFEEQTHLQAERAQILADAGAFFSSNIDPTWVTQAIAERTAEVLGDWSAVILHSADAKELRVAAIYHRDMASLGLAWSYIYRQPLVVGEGIIGQVIATGYPSLTTNVRPSLDRTNPGTYHPSSGNLASLLVLPLRTRREMLGALVIAANSADRAMTDDKLPLAEILAERAALAIENAKLYTEQVEARRKVEDLSRLKDEFLSIASHELRTPVTSIKGYTQLAKMLIKEGDLSTSDEYLDIALDQIERMSRLILELLDVSRIETGRLEIRRDHIAWAHFVRDVVHRHHTAVSDRRFHVSVPDDSKIVAGDRDRLEQVLGNLLENAVKYSPDGSDITVTVEDRGDSFVTAVCDRGIGIPADELGQVFERFHRGRQVSSTNYGGLGLGLYITKQIIERHGGTIWVESKEGQGTTFHFSLPVAEQGAIAALPPAEVGAQT
ncbi:MAG TPA: ATP-binding protein [Thermoanaerobaculia bacterium]|nr:ATP-binding protein [Thermoanaerobaculia bacterium]